jgi:EAL domain-containing protein (putative c-di-GMP-specific phosphodiesterase class I)/GGDEF domain-containing protein
MNGGEEQGGAVPLVDARGRPDAALTDVVALAADGGPLLVLLAAGEDPLPYAAAGASHFLTEPCDDASVTAARRFAAMARLHERRTPLGEAAEIPNAFPAQRDKAVIAVALSRIDLLNAAHGRGAGDAALLQAAERICAATGASVTTLSAARFLVAVDRGAAAAAVARIAQALARPYAIGDVPVMAGARLGLAQPEAGDDTAALVRRAIDALEHARASDGATVRVAAREGAAPPDELAIDLHHAVAAGEIAVVFQPQVEIATGHIVGVEALARWSHPRLGSLGAEELFAAADRADLGIALSDHIQELALARAAAWPRSLGALRLSVNLTAADVTRAGFARLFLDRVDASGFPRGRLTVEVTETGMIRELDAAAALLAELRGAGCRVAIDDFGTGYSSLAYLKALPLDYLKIDKALARDITGNPRDRVVVRGVIEIARALGLAVIAEGVETPQQLALLAAEGCGWYQGFLRAGPLDEAALVRMVEGQ